MKTTTHLILLIVVSCTLASFLLAVINLVFTGGFGLVDLPIFLIWTLLFSLTIVIVALLAQKLPLYDRRNIRQIFAALLSVLTSFVWTAFMGLFYGASIRAFNIAEFTIWAMAGYLSLILALRTVGTNKQKSSLSWKGVLAAIIVPFLCVGVAGFSFLTLVKIEEFTAEERLYLIPEGYVGPILIVYDRPDGQPAHYEEEVQVFTVPQNGVLLTQVSTSTTGGRFWYVDDQGNKTREITWNTSCTSELPGDPLVACMHGGLRRVNGQLLPRHSYLIIGPESEQSALTNEWSEWKINILQSLIH